MTENFGVTCAQQTGVDWALVGLSTGTTQLDTTGQQSEQVISGPSQISQPKPICHKTKKKPKT